MDVIKRSVKVGNRNFLFEIISADNFTVTPPMKNRELAESKVWNIITGPSRKIKGIRPRRRGGVKG